jgi:hypothetical protein
MEYIEEQKKVINELESVNEALAKDLEKWKKAVTQGFDNVEQILGKQVDTCPRSKRIGK